MTSIRRPFRRAPAALRTFIVGSVVAALALPFLLRHLGQTSTKNPLVATFVALLVVSILNVEIGRLLEGGISTTDRAHKALSAWGFGAALLLPMPFILPVVAVSYAHARWRGMRVPLWKWVGSAAFVVLAGVAAAVVVRALHGPNPNLMDDDGGYGLLASCCGAAVFLVVETLLFHGSAYLNHPEDEAWLRRTLAGRSFYVTEACVLLMGALFAAVWTAGAWFMLLLVPVFTLAQQAALNEPLRERAETDDKTGLLRFESWRALAVTEQRRCELKGRPWSIAFADLDHFKRYNDEFGHLVGDSALLEVADVLREQLRGRDLVGRFGGEEFGVFLPDTRAEEAHAIAERLCRAVAKRELPGSGRRTTVSLGVVTFAGGADSPRFTDALTAADRALFRAKTLGRNRVEQQDVRAGDRDWFTADPQPSSVPD